MKSGATLSSSTLCFSSALATTNCFLGVSELSTSTHGHVLHAPDTYAPVWTMLKENFFNPFSNIDLQCFTVWLLQTMLQWRALYIHTFTNSVSLASGSAPKNNIVESNFICIFLLIPKLPSKYVTPIYSPTTNLEGFLLPDTLLSLSNTRHHGTSRCMSVQ